MKYTYRIPCGKEWRYKPGDKLDEEFRNYIIGTFRFSQHAINRLVERTSRFKRYKLVDVAGTWVKKLNIAETRIRLICALLRERVLDYVDNEGNIIMAIGKYEYVVFSCAEEEINLVTYINDTNTGYTVFDKLRLTKENNA